MLAEWLDENRDRLHQNWDAQIDDATLMSFELGAYLYDPDGQASSG